MKKMGKKKLFLLDAYALIYRSYFAFINNPRRNSDGLNTSAMLGFTNTLDELLRVEKPDYIAVAFDVHAPTFRHKIYEPYKANRDAMPEDLRISVPYIRDIIAAYNIPIVEMEGYEADDIVGALSHKFASDDLTVYMMTPDKDYAQLVTENAYLYKPKKGGDDPQVWGVEDVCLNFNIENCSQVIDILGLMGDASDNIPGCPGVGPKTAQKLIGEFGSIDGIYKNIEKLKGKQKERLIENEEQVKLSKLLATIVIDIPLPFIIDDFKRKQIDVDKLSTLFTQFEFRRQLDALKRAYPTETAKPKEKAVEIVKSTDYESGKQMDIFDILSPKAVDNPVDNSDDKAEVIVNNVVDSTVDNFYEPGTLFGPPIVIEEPVASKSVVALKDKDYSTVSGVAEIKKLVKKLIKGDAICFDTETTSVNPMLAELVGISFSIKKDQGFYIPVSADRKEAEATVALLNSIFNSGKLLVAQNVKYDIIVLRRYGATFSENIFDTMIAHYLVQPELRHNLDYLSELYLNYEKISTEQLIGKKGKNQLSMRDIPVETVSQYACEDADCTLQLMPILKEEMEKRGVTKLFDEVEMPLTQSLIEMELNGVAIDTEALNIYAERLQVEISSLELQIMDIAGVTFNIASPKQLGEVLFDTLKLNAKAKKTKSGQYQTGEEVLTKLATKHEIAKLILEFRGLKKLLSTYVQALPELVNSETGRIHTSFNQTVVSTGRLSSTNPNLQNIPIRTKNGREIRKSFVVDGDDKTFLSADYSQVELRIMAAVSEDKSMIEAFREGIDIHTATAAKLNKVSVEEVTDDMRRAAKTANFGIIYGISAFGLSQRLGVSSKDAKILIEGYFESFPGVKRYMDNAVKEASDRGYVTTLYGRKRFLNDINSDNRMVRGIAERNAINAPIQGSAADIIKIAMINILRRIQNEKLKSKMILQVHDELNFEVPNDELDIMTALVKEEMEGAVDIAVPLTVEVGAGRSWYDAH